MALVDTRVSLCCRINLHLWLYSVFPSPVLADLHLRNMYFVLLYRTTHMKISVTKQFSTIFVPNNWGPRFAFGNTKKHNFMTKNIFVVKMGSLCYLRSLKIGKNDYILHKSLSHPLASIPLRSLVVRPVLSTNQSLVFHYFNQWEASIYLSVGCQDLAVSSVATNISTNS